MEFPRFAPKALDRYQTLASEEAVFEELVKFPQELLMLLEVACDDETWKENHEPLISKILEWLTTQTSIGRLDKGIYQNAAHIIQKHYLSLKSLLPTPLSIQLKDGEIPFNGMLLMAASDLFKQILLAESRDKADKTLSFPHLTAREFSSLGAFITMGEVPDLSTKGPDEIISLIRRADAWELSSLGAACERTLVKYLTVDNVFEMLALAIRERWQYFAQCCMAFVNKRGWGFRLHAESLECLEFEFLDFLEPTIEFFETLRPLIQGIICSGRLVEEPQFGLILIECPNLYKLNISGTHTFSNQFQEIPKGLQSLNLSECSWLSKETIKPILNLCPNLHHLIMRSNTQLNYIVWGEISKFKQLKTLDLSQCSQLQDQELALLLKGLRNLTELSLRGCDQIREQGFLEIAKNLPHLLRLDLSRCAVSETALVEIRTHCPRAKIKLSP